MSALFVWNPSYIGDDKSKLSFFVTHGQVTDVVFNDLDFLSAVLSELSIDGMIESWTVKPYRTDYFGDNPDSDIWWDVWPIAWKFSLVGSGEFAIPTGYDRLWTGTNAFGDDEAEPPSEKKPAECLVLADFDSIAGLAEARDAIAAADFTTVGVSNSATQLTISEGLAYGKYPQLQVSLGEREPGFFESGADYARAVQNVLRQAGGTTDHTARL